MCHAPQETVLQIASLKRVGKGTKILLLDSNGGTAKGIARGLSGRGFRNVLVISGGYSGWTSQKLQTKLSSSVRPSFPLLHLPPPNVVTCMSRVSWGAHIEHDPFHIFDCPSLSGHA